MVGRFNMPNFFGGNREEEAKKVAPVEVALPPIMQRPPVALPRLITAIPQPQTAVKFPQTTAAVEAYNAKVVAPLDATPYERAKAAYTTRFRGMNGFPITMTNPLSYTRYIPQNPVVPTPENERLVPLEFFANSDSMRVAYQQRRANEPIDSRIVSYLARRDARYTEPTNIEKPTVQFNNPIPRDNRTNFWGNTQAHQLSVAASASVTGVSPLLVRRTANWATDIAEQHAMDLGLFHENGDPNLWHNEADAMRHFLWNARMTRDFGRSQAASVADRYEMVTWSNTRLQGGIAYRVSFASLMDMANNAVGREYASRYPDLSYDELFVRAWEDGSLITSLDGVPNLHGLSVDQIFVDGFDRSVLLFLPNDSRQPLFFMTMEDYKRLSR